MASRSSSVTSRESTITMAGQARNARGQQPARQRSTPGNTSLRVALLQDAMWPMRPDPTVAELYQAAVGARSYTQIQTAASSYTGSTHSETNRGPADSKPSPQWPAPHLQPVIPDPVLGPCRPLTQSALEAHDAVMIRMMMEGLCGDGDDDDDDNDGVYSLLAMKGSCGSNPSSRPSSTTSGSSSASTRTRTPVFDADTDVAGIGQQFIDAMVHPTDIDFDLE
jgi:hypothetical protein